MDVSAHDKDLFVVSRVVQASERRPRVYHARHLRLLVSRRLDLDQIYITQGVLRLCILGTSDDIDPRAFRIVSYLGHVKIFEVEHILPALPLH